MGVSLARLNSPSLPKKAHSLARMSPMARTEVGGTSLFLPRGGVVVRGEGPLAAVTLLSRIP